MVESLVVITIAALVIGPLAWSSWRDRRQTEALAVRARLQWVVDRNLGGESLIAVAVAPPTIWRSGRVLLSAPADWEWLLERVWKVVIREVPAGYELVVPGRTRATITFPPTAVARRAA